MLRFVLKNLETDSECFGRNLAKQRGKFGRWLIKLYLNCTEVQVKLLILTLLFDQISSLNLKFSQFCLSFTVQMFFFCFLSFSEFILGTKIFKYSCLSFVSPFQFNSSLILILKLLLYITENYWYNFKDYYCRKMRKFCVEIRAWLDFLCCIPSDCFFFPKNCRCFERFVCK